MSNNVIAEPPALSSTFSPPWLEAPDSNAPHPSWSPKVEPVAPAAPTGALLNSPTLDAEHATAPAPIVGEFKSMQVPPAPVAWAPPRAPNALTPSNDSAPAAPIVSE